MEILDQNLEFDELINPMTLGEFSHLAAVESTKCCATGTCDD